MHGSTNLQHASILFYTTQTTPPIRHQLVDLAYNVRHYPITYSHLSPKFTNISRRIGLWRGYGTGMAMPVDLNKPL